MRSSRSTPSRSAEAGPPLFVLVVGEDHPRACTGRRLLRAGLASPFRRGPGRAPGPILLDPRATEPLSPADADRVRRTGLLAVDCSWNRLDERGGFDPALTALRGLPRRRLPWLFAANPQHYGRLAELNTAEALAAALEVVGEGSRADRLLGTFAGGDGFRPLNAALLAAYREATGPDGLRAAEREFF